MTAIMIQENPTILETSGIKSQLDEGEIFQKIIQKIINKGIGLENAKIIFKQSLDYQIPTEVLLAKNQFQLLRIAKTEPIGL